MANIQLLQGTEKIKDSYTKINTSVTNLNNAKVEKSGDTMAGGLDFGRNNIGLQMRNGDNTSQLILADFPDVNTAGVEVRLFRYTNTTGNRDFILFRGDGSLNSDFYIRNGRIIVLNGQQATITAYEGNPNGNVAAPPGSVCLNTAGGAGASIYVKESGTGNTGWVAK